MYYCLSSKSTAECIKYRTVKSTRKLSYRKDDRAMRPMYGMGALKIFGSP